MPVWLNTRGNTTLAIGLCDRCHKKRALVDLVPDGNAPGMRVCQERCRDVLDPYRLPARQPDDITLPFYRPIVPSLTFETATPVFDGLSNADADKWIEPLSPFGPAEGGMYGIEVTD